VKPLDSPEAPQTLLTGEEELRLALELLRGRVDAHLEEFETRLDDSLTTPVRSAFQRAHATHAALMEAAGLGEVEKVEPLSGAAVWKRLRQYREGLHREVLVPLRHSLNEIQIGSRVALHWEGFQNGLPGLADGLAEVIHRPEPTDLYGTRAGDGAGVAAGKAVIRGQRAVENVFGYFRGRVGRLFGRSAPVPSPREVALPLRPLARSCLLGHCPLALEPFTEALHQHYAGPVSLLATAASGWTRQWFPAESATHTPRGHLPPELLSRIDSLLLSTAGKEPETVEPVDERLNERGDAALRASPNPSAIAATLHSALAEGASLEGPTRGLLRIREALDREWDDLLEAIRVSGSFQRSRAAARAEVRIKRLDARFKARASQWIDWHPATLERVHLAILLLRLRESWDKAQDDLLIRLATDSVLPLSDSWIEVRNGLQGLRKEAESTFSGTPGVEDLKGLAEEVTALLDRSETLLEEKLINPVRDGEGARGVSRVADAVATNLSDALRALPETVILNPLPKESFRVDPALDRRTIPIRDVILQIMDVLRLEAIRTSPAPFLELLKSAQVKCAEIPKIVSYNLTSARDELLNPPQVPVDSIMEEARALVFDGLGNTTQGVETLLAEIPESWQTLASGSHSLLSECFDEIHARAVVEGSVQEQILDLHSMVQSRLRIGVEQSRVMVGKIARISSRFLKRVWIHGVRLVHLGRSAVGATGNLDGEAERALEVLRTIPSLLEPLPLVYRRLFSFQPISDPTLLVARESEIVWVRRRFEAWKEGFGSPGLIMGPEGRGHTSLLNVLVDSVFQGTRVYRTELTDRIRSEEGLASYLAELMGLKQDGDWNFTGLSRTLQDEGSPGPFGVVILEHLEHLLLRTPGGTELLGRFISFQAKTAKRVFWLSGTSEVAWKFLEKSEPESADLVATRSLSPLSRDDLEKLVLTRHQRSGLPLEFVQPDDLNPLVRRRLRRSRSEKAKQGILQAESFDRIFRISEGSVPMAILIWLRSIDFASKEGCLRVSPPKPLRFTFLEGLSLSLDFALMAFLEHGSLSLGEYGIVFQCSQEEAYQVFEALRIRMLLEPMGLRGSLPTYLDSIESGKRYRVPPILGRAVAQRLRNRNILH